MNKKPWTPEEKELLAKLFPTHPTTYCAEVLGRHHSGVTQAAIRFGLKKAPPTELSKTGKILEACKPDTGLTVVDLAQAIGASKDISNTLAQLLCRQGRLFKAGLFKHTKYFATQEAADAWNIEANDDHRQKLEAARLKKQAARNLARKLQRAKEAKALGKEAPKMPSRTAPKPKPVEIRRAPPAPTAAKPAKVIWPEHVKVQTIPTPPSRFAFEPPKGWRGQITHDWMDRRLSGAHGRKEASK